MSKDIKTYILIVVLPAILLVAGGIRLITLESARARASAIQALDERASSLAQKIKDEIGKAGPPNKWQRPMDMGGGPKARGRGPHGLIRKHPRDRKCCQHELPPELLAIIKKYVKNGGSADEKPQITELRHSCGCVIFSGGTMPSGKVFGKASLKPFLPDYFITIAPGGGDAEVAMGVRAQAMLAAILFLLLCGTLSAGVALLVRAARRAADEARRKTDFLSNVSHELKTPLTSIALFSEMLCGDALDEESRKKASKTIREESKRLGRLIDGLLEYARMERGVHAYDITDFDIKSLLDEVLSAFLPSFPCGLELECDQSRIHADRDATRRILGCILENAAKYAANDGKVTITASNGAISVADIGPGLSQEESRHVFERFWRADNSVTRTTGGTGIGLSIAAELAKGMGATLSLRPNSPRGCIFTLTFGTKAKGTDHG